MTSISSDFIRFPAEEARFFAQRAKACHYDLFLASAAAPASARASLHLLLCVAHELERATEVASEPLLAMIRLTWWREAIEEIITGQQPRAHELVAPLALLLQWKPAVAHRLLAMIEAHAMELEPECWDEPASWNRYLLQGYGGIIGCWGDVLALEESNDMAQAFALTYIWRNVPKAAHQGVLRLPKHWFDEVGLEYAVQAVYQPSMKLNLLGGILVNHVKNGLPTDRKEKIYRAIIMVAKFRIKQGENLSMNLYDSRMAHAPILLYINLLALCICG